MAVFNAIKGYIAEHGYAPTVRELSEITELTTSSVHNHLVTLKRHEFISYIPGYARTIRVLKEAA